MTTQRHEDAKPKLYGDGIRDDYPAIQQLLDNGAVAVRLPMPKKEYVISKTLVIHSDQQLILDRYARIRLADNSNCLMIRNAVPHKDKNICVEGGVWDMNHTKQLPNPFRFPPDELDNPIYYEKPHSNKTLYAQWNQNALKGRDFLNVYCGMAMQFNGIKGLTLKGLTIRNPVVYGVQAAHLTHFLIEDIYFEYTEGSPKLWNMDGVHLEGGCHYGVIRNLRGNCHDDTVALTADDSLHGEISDVRIDGIYAEGPSHSAVRLLSYKTPVRNIRISNVFGRFYTYCIGITKYGGLPEDRGVMENICIDNVFAENCCGTQDVSGGRYPFLFIEGGLRINSLSVVNAFREESFSHLPFIFIGDNSVVDHMSLRNVRQKNRLGSEIAFLENRGIIGRLSVQEVQTDGVPLVVGSGTVGESDLH